MKFISTYNIHNFLITFIKTQKQSEIQLIKAVLPYLISKQKNIEDLQQEQPLFQIEIIGSLSKN